MRQAVLVIFSLAFLAFLAITGYWLWSAKALEAGLEEWRNAQAEKGYRITFSEPDLSGYPFTLLMSLDTPIVESPNGWRWQGHTLRLRSNLLDPSTLTLEGNGKQEAFLPAANLGAESRLVANDSSFWIRLDKFGQAEAGEGALFGISESSANGTSLEGRSVTFALQKNPGSNGQAPSSVKINMAVEVLSLPQLNLPLIGQVLNQLELEFVLHGPLIQNLTASELEYWRDRGGALEVADLFLDWQPLGLTGSGRIGLDQERRIAGQLDIWWRNLPNLIDQAAGQGLLQPNAALPLKVGLFALPSRRSADGVAERKLPLVFNNGQAFLGPVPLGPLSPLP